MENETPRTKQRQDTRLKRLQYFESLRSSSFSPSEVADDNSNWLVRSEVTRHKTELPVAQKAVESETNGKQSDDKLSDKYGKSRLEGTSDLSVDSSLCWNGDPLLPKLTTASYKSVQQSPMASLVEPELNTSRSNQSNSSSLLSLNKTSSQKHQQLRQSSTSDVGRNSVSSSRKTAGQAAVSGLPTVNCCDTDNDTVSLSSNSDSISEIVEALDSHDMQLASDPSNNELGIGVLQCRSPQVAVSLEMFRPSSSRLSDAGSDQKLSQSSRHFLEESDAFKPANASDDKSSKYGYSQSSIFELNDEMLGESFERLKMTGSRTTDRSAGVLSNDRPLPTTSSIASRADSLNATAGKSDLPLNTAKLQSVLGRERLERLMRNLHDFKQMSDGTGTGENPSKDQTANSRTTTESMSKTNFELSLQRIPSCSLLLLNESPTTSESVEQNIAAAGRTYTISSADHRRTSSSSLASPKSLKPTSSQLAHNPTLLAGHVSCSYTVDEIYAEANRMNAAKSSHNGGKSSAPNHSNSTAFASSPSWLLLTDSFKNEDVEMSFVKPEVKTQSSAVKRHETSSGSTSVEGSDNVKQGRPNGTEYEKRGPVNCWVDPEDDKHSRMSRTSRSAAISLQQRKDTVPKHNSITRSTNNPTSRKSEEVNTQEVSGNLGQSSPYSEDSISRYFRSLETVVADEQVVAFDPLPDMECNGNERCMPQPNSSLSRRIKSSEDQKMFEDSDAGALFRRVTASSYQPQGLKSTEQSVNFPADFASVRDSEDFVYDDHARRKRLAMEHIPADLRNELAVCLGESLNGGSTKTFDPSKATSAAGETGLKSKFPQAPALVVDSMTFDYADVENPKDALPETLKQQLHLDLRNLRESYELDPKFTASQSNVSKTKQVQFHAPKKSALDSSKKRREEVYSRQQPVRITAKEDDKSTNKSLLRGDSSTGSPVLSKSVASQHQTRDSRSAAVNVRALASSTTSTTDGGQAEVETASESIRFKTADYLKYKREKRNADLRSSKELSQLGSRPKSAPFAGSSLTVAWSAALVQESVGDSFETPLIENWRRSRSPERKSDLNTVVDHSQESDQSDVALGAKRSKQVTAGSMRRSNSGLLQLHEERNSSPEVRASTTRHHRSPATRHGHHADQRPAPAAVTRSATCGSFTSKGTLVRFTTEDFGKYISMSPRIQSGELSMMTCLPDEMLLKIFNYLPLSDVARCAAVCKHFYRVALDPSLWKNITVTKRSLTDASLACIGRHEPVSLNMIQCRGDKVSTDGIRDLFRQCAESLMELNITGCKTGQLTGDNLLLHASSRCGNITHLDASWTGVSASGVMAFSDNCQQLVSVCVNGCQAISDEAVSSLTGKHGQSLQTLELFGLFGLTHVALNSIAKNCPNLVTLNLGQCWKLTDGSIAQLSSCLKKVENLDLRGCKQVNDHTVHRIAENCSKLRTLSVANCTLVSDSALAEVAAYCTQLRSLDVCGCSKVTNVGVKSLVAGCTHLKTLDVSSTAVNHRGVVAISNSCKKNLQVLKLNFCKQITVDCLVRLARNCKRLSRLFLYGVTSVRQIDEILQANSSVWIER